MLIGEKGRVNIMLNSVENKKRKMKLFVWYYSREVNEINTQNWYISMEYI